MKYIHKSNKSVGKKLGKILKNLDKYLLMYFEGIKKLSVGFLFLKLDYRK